MESLRIDDGFKSFMINDDPDKVIRFSPADIGIIERIRDAYNNVDKYRESIGKDIELNANGEPLEQLQSSANVVAKFRKYICDQIDMIFDSPVSEVVFGNQSPLSTVKGKAYYERFLEAVMPVIEAEVKKEQLASKKRIAKYTGQVK